MKFIFKTKASFKAKKRIVAFVVFLCLLGSLQSSALAVEGGLIGTTNSGGTFDIDLFGTLDSNIGKDIYEKIYEKMKNGSREAAIKKVLADNSVSEEELIGVINGAQLAPISIGKVDEAVTAVDIAVNRTNLKNVYSEEKELADLTTAAEIDALPSELFSNGDESDSGFDLISDLNVIDMILFGKSETSLSNTGDGSHPTPTVLDIARGGSGTDVSSVDSPRSGASSGSSRSGGAADGTGSSAGAQDFGTDIPGTICPLNEGFNSAVSQARAEEKTEAADRAAGGGEGAGNGGERNGNGGNGAGDDSSAGNRAEQPLVPEPPADWSRKIACTKPFCLFIEEVYKQESSYQASSNCVACHFEKINDAFNKALSRSLVPSKATGNLFELAKCKNWMFNLEQNFILVAKPIMTPPNDDLVVRGNFLLNLMEFARKYESKDHRMNRAEAAARTIQQKTGSTATPKDILGEIQHVVNDERDQEIKEIKASTITNKAAATGSATSVLMQEINTMNAYFKSYFDIYKKLLDGAGSACKKLKGKPECY